MNKALALSIAFVFWAAFIGALLIVFFHMTLWGQLFLGGLAVYGLGHVILCSDSK